MLPTGAVLTAATFFEGCIMKRIIRAQSYAHQSSVIWNGPQPDAITVTQAQVSISCTGTASCDLRYTASNGNVVQIPGSPFTSGTYNIQTGQLFHYTLGTSGGSTISYN
jgi:hypothetical protein